MISNPTGLDELLARARDFVREVLIPNEERIEREQRVADDLLHAMRAFGLFGFSIPREFGGLGLSMEEEVLLMFELGQTSPAYRARYALNNGGGSRSIMTDGTPEQQAHYLPRMASGQLTAAFALSEPEAGSDAASITTVAQRDGDDYVLNGTKRYVLNGPEADVVIVMARTGALEQGPRGISAFIVDKPRAGLRVGEIDENLGHHGVKTCELHFENCRVAGNALIGGKEGGGLKIALKSIDKARLHVAAVCVGTGQRMLDEALTHARTRKQFGQAIGEFQMIQAMLADSQAELFAARAMVLDAARKRDEGVDVTAEVASCKLFASEMAGRVADRALQIHGGAGYTRRHVIERFYRDVRLFRILDGTSEIQRLVIARQLMNRPS